jgi:putative ABC transport system ATP-binding protein
MNQSLAIHCIGLQRSFGEGAAQVRALRGVSLQVRRGEVMMLVGPSGCGKTTLISIVSAVLDADGGECDVLGQSVVRMSAAQKTVFRRRTIGFVFQAFNLLPQLSAAENVALPLLVSGMVRSQALAHAHVLLDRMDLASRAEDTPAMLSGGQQQRVAITRALVHRPPVVVCDEPTSALDHHTGESVMQALVDAVREQQTTLLVVTHDARIFKFADRVAEMEDGRIARIGQGVLA